MNTNKRMERINILIIIVIIIFSLYACQKQNMQSASEMPGFTRPMDMGNREVEKKITKDNDRENYKRGEILVKFKLNVSKEMVDRIAQDYDLKIIRLISAPYLYLFEISGDLSVKEAIQQLNKLVEVEYAEPNYTRKMK
jgi:hypothetical protein